MDAFEVVPYIISSVILLLSVYVLLRKKARTLFITVTVIVPLVLTTIDIFVKGDMTVFRQIFFSLYALFILTVSIKGRI